MSNLTYDDDDPVASALVSVQRGAGGGAGVPEAWGEIVDGETLQVTVLNRSQD